MIERALAAIGFGCIVAVLVAATWTAVGWVRSFRRARGAKGTLLGQTPTTLDPWSLRKILNDRRRG